jgi:hypothetical protein
LPRRETYATLGSVRLWWADRDRDPNMVSVGEYDSRPAATWRSSAGSNAGTKVRAHAHT